MSLKMFILSCQTAFDWLRRHIFCNYFHAFRFNIYLFVYFLLCSKRLFNEHIERNYQAPAEDRPGGFMWGGEGQPLIADQEPEVEPVDAPQAENQAAQ